MKAFYQILFLLVFALMGACGNKKNAEDEVFGDIQFHDVKDQDALALDASAVNSKTVSTSSLTFNFFQKSDEGLKLGSFLWTQKWHATWLEGCVGKTSTSRYRCVLNSKSGEKAVVLVQLNSSGMAQKIFVDSKGDQHPSFWETELKNSQFFKTGEKTFASQKMQTKAKIVFVKKANAATLILEKL